MVDNPYTQAFRQDLLLKKCKEENRPPTDEELASVAKPPPPSLSGLKRRSKRENNCYFCGYTDKNNMNRHLGLTQDGRNETKPNCKVLKSMDDDSLAKFTNQDDALERTLEKNATLEQCNVTFQNLLEKCKEKDKNPLDYGYNYIIQTRESIQLNENVFKIGQTKCMMDRMRHYPRGSKIIHFRDSKNDVESERMLKSEFKHLFVQRRDYGTEYFEGELSDIKIEFDKILDQYQI